MMPYRPEPEETVYDLTIAKANEIAPGFARNGGHTVYIVQSPEEGARCTLRIGNFPRDSPIIGIATQMGTIALSHPMTIGEAVEHLKVTDADGQRGTILHWKEEPATFRVAYSTNRAIMREIRPALSSWYQQEETR